MYLGAGSIGITHAATSSGERPIYLPVEPCRLADLRPAPDTVGPRSAALGPQETFTLSGWSAVGDCTLPSNTAGLALNVTALGATEPTFLTLFPADAVGLPNASDLNPVPGQPPFPNAVNVDHDDRYYTEGEVDAALAAGFTSGPRLPVDFVNPANTDQVIGDINLPAGDFIVNASVVANNNAGTPDEFGCRLFLGSRMIAETAFNNLELAPNVNAASRESVALTGGGTLAAPGTASVLCRASTVTGNWLGLSITAIKVSSVTQS